MLLFGAQHLETNIINISHSIFFNSEIVFVGKFGTETDKGQQVLHIIKTKLLQNWIQSNILILN